MGAPICEPVLRPFVGDVFDRLDAAQMETWQERCAVIEFDAGVSRSLAEALALIELLRREPSILTEVHVLEVDLDGQTQWLLTDDLAHARLVVADLGGVEIDCPPVGEVVRTQYGGIALLGTLG